MFGDRSNGWTRRRSTLNSIKFSQKKNIFPFFWLFERLIRVPLRTRNVEIFSQIILSTWMHIAHKSTTQMQLQTPKKMSEEKSNMIICDFIHGIKDKNISPFSVTSFYAASFSSVDFAGKAFHFELNVVDFFLMQLLLLLFLVSFFSSFASFFIVSIFIPEKVTLFITALQQSSAKCEMMNLGCIIFESNVVVVHLFSTSVTLSPIWNHIRIEWNSICRVVLSHV